MSKPKHQVHFSKRFLNKDGFMSDASIFSSVLIQTGYQVTEYLELKIRSCNDSVSLELTLEDEGCGDNSFENSLYKIDSLIQELALLKVKLKEGKIIFDREKEALKVREAEEKEREKNENHEENG